MCLTFLLSRPPATTNRPEKFQSRYRLAARVSISERGRASPFIFQFATLRFDFAKKTERSADKVTKLVLGVNLKLLVVLGILAVIFLFIYLRLRPFIRMARQMFSVARDVRHAVRQEPATSSTHSGGAGDRLVRCASCETWVPSSRAIKLRSSTASYCSHDCLERTAEVSKHKAAG